MCGGESPVIRISLCVVTGRGKVVRNQLGNMSQMSEESLYSIKVTLPS